MKLSSQNLRPSRVARGSILWHGRAWFRSRKSYDELFHVEWYLGSHARGFGLWISFGYGDSDSGICLHACIPLLFSVYLTFPHVFRCKECKTGIAIHNSAFWIYPIADSMEYRSDFPWWRKSYSWNFPWTWDWYKTEILTDNMEPVWSERKGRRNRDPFKGLNERQRMAAIVTDDYPYEYRLKNGEIQKRTASVHIVRMEWRMKWWPLLPFKKVRTSIDFVFNEEVGERTGSWKGGCIGSGYDMLPGETKRQTLRRMERERKFD